MWDYYIFGIKLFSLIFKSVYVCVLSHFSTNRSVERRREAALEIIISQKCHDFRLPEW